MRRYGINKIEEDCETRMGTVMAEDIYEAAKLFKSITDSDKTSNYTIFEMDSESNDYLMVGSYDNNLMLYNALKWMLMDEGKI